MAFGKLAKRITDAAKKSVMDTVQSATTSITAPKPMETTMPRSEPPSVGEGIRTTGSRLRGLGQDIRSAVKNSGKGFRSRYIGLKSGGKVGSASKRADGIAQRGKTKGKII